MYRYLRNIFLITIAVLLILTGLAYSKVSIPTTKKPQVKKANSVISTVKPNASNSITRITDQNKVSVPGPTVKTMKKLQIKYDEITFDQSIDKADAIVMITIIKRTGEAQNPSPTTLFDAKILEVYKGRNILKTNQHITLLQDGNSTVSANGIPLFNNNEIMILFLKKAPGYKNAFSIISGPANTYKFIPGALKKYIVKQDKLDKLLFIIDAAASDVIDQRDEDLIRSLYMQAYSSQRQLEIFEFNSFTNRLEELIKEKESPFIIKHDINTVDKNLLYSSDKFGLDIFESEVASTKNQNVIISPLSLFTAFNITAAGASGKTQEQMKKVLGTDSYSQEGLNNVMNDFINYANIAESNGYPGYTKIYTSLWINKGFDVKDSFIDTSKKYYDADIFKKDLADKNTIKDMNKWIFDKSGGLINNPITDIDKGTRLNIFNVLHFLGKWTEPFDKSKTMKDTFTTSDSTSLTVDMMNAKRTMQYYEDDSTKAGSFNYYNGQMLILLPKGDINSFITNLTVDKINYYNKSLNNLYTVKIKMPKLNIAFKDNLNKILQDMGMTLPFDAANAEFDNIKKNNDKLFIGQVLHDCVVKLDEEGTEAAALTSIGLAGAAMPPPEIKEFYVDKPFVFAIEDHNGLIYFIGKVEKPVK